MLQINKCHKDTKTLVFKQKQESRRKRKNKLKAIYTNQIVNSKRRKHPHPEYTFSEFRTWAMARGYDQLFDQWKDSNFESDLAPSGDRIDSSEPYSLNNLQLVTWKENKENYIKELLTKSKDNFSFYIEDDVLIISDWNDDVDLVLRCLRHQIEILPSKVIYSDSDKEWFKLKINYFGYFEAFESLQTGLVESVYCKNTALGYILSN